MEQENNNAAEAEFEKIEETTTQSPSFGERAKMMGQAAVNFAKRAGSEKINAYKEAPVKEGFKDIVTLGLFWLAKKSVKTIAKGFKSKETED